MYQQFRKPTASVLVPLVLLLLFVVACGSASQPIQPQGAGTQAATQVPNAVTIAPTVTPPATVQVAATPVPGLYQAEVPEWVSVGGDHHYNGTIRFVHRANPGFLDLHYGASSTTTLMPAGPRFNQLLQYDPTNPEEIIGDLAESWDVSEDGLTYTFHIARANWQDGVPVTADDVVFSLDRMAEEGVTRGRVIAVRDFYEPGTARAVDDRTVEMPLKYPSSTALGWLAVDYFKIYARHVVEGKTQDELNCCYENNVGSGPWQFKEWKKGDSWEFERNDDYFKNPIPFYDYQKVFVIEDAARRLASMKTGQVDAWLVMGGTSLQDMLQVQKDSGGKMRAALGNVGTLRGFWLHWNRPPLDDPRVRKAIYLTIDRQDIAYTVLGDEGIIGNYFPPGYAQSNEEILQLPGFRYVDGAKDPQDLAEARRLLTEAGFPDGFKLTFNVDEAKEARTEAELVASQLKKNLNIDVDLQVADRATFYANLRDGNHSLSVIGTSLFFLEPETVVVQWYAKDSLRNPHNWENPRMNELMALQARELNSEVRRGYYREMAEILDQGDNHWIPLYWQRVAGAVDYRIQNFRPPYHPHTIWKWDQIWWDPDAPIPSPDAPALE
jgi:peptide/nickel transport system substrate-binding protein